MKPPGLESIRRFQPVHLRKMNKFSINQIVKIRSDWLTIKEIDEEFGQIQLKEKKVEFIYFYSFILIMFKLWFIYQIEGSVGRVTGIDVNDVDKVFVQFDQEEIYNWLDKNKSLPSRWMKEFEKNPKDPEYSPSSRLYAEKFWSKYLCNEIIFQICNGN